jgi:hypothetical protein
MTKQEQIEEVAKLLRVKEGIYREEIHHCEDDMHCEKCCCLYKSEAEALYEAGYRKIREKDETLEEQIKHLNTIVERLDELLWKGIDEYIKGIDGVEGLKDMWERSAVREFAEKVKEKALLHCRTINCYECKFIETTIDELLKEYE